MRVVLDTNVIVSAILFGGKPRQILKAGISGTIRIHISNTLVAELQGVLQKPKFGFNSQIIQSIIAEMTSLAEWVEPKEHFDLIDDDPADNQVIDCAIEAKADYIISGDRHLLNLGKCGNTLIVNPDSFTKVLAQESGESRT
jgi:uncharacterized protein